MMNLLRELELTPDLQAAVSQVRSALDSRENASLAVDANARTLESANSLHPELEKTAAHLYAEVIKSEALAAANATSKADLTKAIKAADKASLDVAENKRGIERATAARDVLINMARDADGAVQLAKAELTSALATFRELPLAGLEDDLRAACVGRIALTDVLAAARAVDAEFPGGLCTQLLDSLKIISPRAYRVGYDEIGRIRVSGSDLLAEEAVTFTLPEEIALSLREINAAVDSLKRFRPYTPPKLSDNTMLKRTEAQQRRFEESVRENDERQKRYDEELVRREARSREPYKTKSAVRQPGTPAPRSMGASNASRLQLDDGGTVSDEWRRIGALPPESADPNLR